MTARPEHREALGCHGAGAAGSEYAVEWITDRARFAAIASDWDRVAARQRSPFLMSMWIAPWCDAFAGTRQPLFAVLWRDGVLIAGLPLLRGWRAWDAAANDHSPEFGLLATDDDARGRIVEAVLSRANALTMPSLPADGAALTALCAAARGLGRWSLVEPGNVSLATETTGSFEEYRAGLSSKVRSEIGRLGRKAKREHHLTLAPLATPDDLDAQLARAFAVEASGWKGRAGTAISSSTRTEDFYRQIARNFHSAGALRLSELAFDGTLAAMAITIIHQRRAFTIKVGYDERYRRVAPGLVLLMAMIERCFELGLDAYEFSGPDADYERRFATTPQRYHQLRIYRPSPLNAARYGYYRCVRPVLRFGYHKLRNSVPHRPPAKPAN